MASRCCWPPESRSRAGAALPSEADEVQRVLGGLVVEAVERGHRAQVLAGGQPHEERRRSGSARRSGAAARVRRGHGFSPSTETVPASASRSPSAISTRVVLPAPLGPSSPKNSPRRDLEPHPVDGPPSAVRLDDAVEDERRGPLVRRGDDSGSRLRPGGGPRGRSRRDVCRCLWRCLRRGPLGWGVRGGPPPHRATADLCQHDRGQHEAGGRGGDTGPAEPGVRRPQQQPGGGGDRRDQERRVGDVRDPRAARVRLHPGVSAGPQHDEEAGLAGVVGHAERVAEQAVAVQRRDRHQVEQRVADPPQQQGGEGVGGGPGRQPPPRRGHRHAAGRARPARRTPR